MVQFEFNGYTVKPVKIENNVLFRFASLASVPIVTHWIDRFVNGRVMKVAHICSSPKCFICKNKLEGVSSSSVFYALVELYTPEYKSLGLGIMGLPRGVLSALSIRETFHPDVNTVLLNHQYHLVHYSGDDRPVGRTSRKNYNHLDAKLAYRNFGDEWVTPMIEALASRSVLETYEQSERVYKESVQTLIDAGLSSQQLELLEP